MLVFRLQPLFRLVDRHCIEVLSCRCRPFQMMFEKPEEASIVIAQYLFVFVMVLFLLATIMFVLGYSGYWK